MFIYGLDMFICISEYMIQYIVYICLYVSICLGMFVCILYSIYACVVLCISKYIIYIVLVVYILNLSTQR